MASLSGNNKIVLKARYSEGGAEHVEGVLAAGASPGMNMQMTGAADTEGRQTWTPGGTDYVGAGTSQTVSKGVPLVLKENSLAGKTINDAYSAGDNGFMHQAESGETLQVLVAAGQTVVKTSGLSAGVDGRWIVDAANPSVEALEASAGALGADTLVRVRVL